MFDRARGVTLIEVIVAIAILAILLSIAVPGLTQFLVTNRLTGQANELVSDISRARNEAGTRSARVSICVSTNGTSCAASGTAWNSGRIVFLDFNGNGAVDDTSETVLKYTPALDGGNSLTASGFPNAGFITFQAFGGLSPATAGTFKLCASGYATGRQVAVAVTGRPLASRIETCP